MTNKTSFERSFEAKVKKTLEGYALLEKGEKVVVAASGGKDSTVVLHLLNKWGFEPRALHVNLGIKTRGYSDEHEESIKRFCGDNGITLHTTSFQKEFGFSVSEIESTYSSTRACSTCGILKRSVLNKTARGLGAARLATGHNLDDEAQAVAMNYLKNNLALGAKLGPKPGVVKDKKFVQRIKPLYFCLEKEVDEYSRFNGFKVQYAKCPCSEGVYRRQVKNGLDALEKGFPGTKEKTIENFLGVLPALRKSFKPRGALAYCRKCGEPSRNAECSACGMLSGLQQTG